MKPWFVVLLLITCSIPSTANVTRFRTGVFLHHSTGGCIWGPNGSSTSVRQEIAKYNDAHGLNAQDSVRMEETGWPVNPWNNEWERWHRIFDNQDTVLADIRPYLVNNRIVVIKSCFPSSSISGMGVSSDTADPTNKTIGNYKWHWRSFIEVMRAHYDNFFVVWTNAPLVASQTDDQQALLSDAFCRWAKDTLAKGLDPVTGPFPENVYVFDFFHKLAGADGKLRPQYASSSGDSHPNAAATALVAPQFVNEIFDAALAYEQVMTVRGGEPDHPREYMLDQNYPNPFNPSTKIQFSLPQTSKITLKVYDLLGREVATLINDEEIRPGIHQILFDASHLSSGVYFYLLQAGTFTQTKKLILLR